MDAEREFLVSLRTIYDIYARPLRKLCSISDDEQKQLFGGIEPILSVSNMLLTKVSIHEMQKTIENEEISHNLELYTLLSGLLLANEGLVCSILGGACVCVCVWETRGNVQLIKSIVFFITVRIVNCVYSSDIAGIFFAFTFQCDVEFRAFNSTPLRNCPSSQFLNGFFFF